MRPVSDDFLTAIRGSHRMVARARICATFQDGVNPDGTEIPIIDGDVQTDSASDVRATLDLTTDGNAWNTRPAGLLTPYGNEVFVERGILLGGGRTEWVSQGYFRITAVEQEDGPDGPVRISGKDRMSGLIDAKLLAPIQFNPTHTIEQFYERLVLDVYPDATIDFGLLAGNIAVNRTVVVEQDRYAALLDMTRSLGMVMFWDHEGHLRVEPPPDPTAPVYEVNAGADGVLVSLSRTLHRDSVFNAVVATGEAPDEKAPARGVARDMNPRSPTYWLGRFGQVPRYYSSPFITTSDQAVNAAESMLARSIGLPHAVDFTTIPNPALEPLDPVLVTTRDGYEVHVLETIATPLVAAEPMTATTRKQVGLIIELGEV